MEARRQNALATFALCAFTIGVSTRAIAIFPATPPNDPLYPPDACPPMSTCAGPTGQWNLFSFAPDVPPTLHASGISADLAWMVTTGSDVVVAILDTGVNYDHEDLRNQIWLNRGELPIPAGACSAPAGDPHDCNNDGVFNILDYASDPAVTDGNGSGARDRGDLRVFVDGIDDDGNGYVDDLSGFDTDDDDGDEFDHRYFGHGTGRAGILAPETDNGVGAAGVCPDCLLMNLRVDDTFVHQSEGAAKAAIYAVDNGARVISMSLGGQGASRLSRGAFDYATAKNVLAINASANEFSFHQNFQAVFDDVMAVGGVTPDNRTLTNSWLQKANFANYGAHLDVVAPIDVPGASMSLGGCGELDNACYTETASGTSSSTPHVAGVAALVLARAGALGIDLSTQEVRQIINRTATDVTPLDLTSYAVSAGWDKFTGYGRVNADAAVDRVGATTIPPEADINAPDWYTLVDGMVTVRFYANARHALLFGYTLEVGSGVEPASFAPLASASGVAANPALSSASRVDNFTASWATGALPQGLYTLRLRVTDNLGNAGEDRMAVWVRHPDPQDLPGFPRLYDGSLESISVALVDLDADNDLEIIFTDGNGEVHAVRPDGSDLPGFPVHTDLPRNLPLASSDAFDGNAANGEVPLSYSSIIGGPAVADIDRDGVQEIVVAALDGQVYCWNADASVCPGFPVSTDFGFTRDQYPPHAQIMNARGEGILATPALGDLDGDDRLEIVAGSLDQKLYVWRADGSRMAPFPIQVFDASSAPGVDEFAPRAIVSSAAVADVDDDGDNEIVVGTNETYATPAPLPVPGLPGGSGRAYLIEADGTIAAGWPVKPTSLAPSAVPVVAEGSPTSPAVADLDGNGTLEIATTAFIGDPTIYRPDGTTFATMLGAPFGATGAGSDANEATPEGGLARATDQPSHFYTGQGIFADLEGDALLDYVAGSVGNGLLTFATGSGTPAIFDHLLSAWAATTGVQKAAFPRVMEDWQFVTAPSVGEVSGDALPEVVATSGGFYVHAFNALGVEPAGWPKLTGQWQTAAPSIGDIDGDGDVEVVQPTRLGTLFVWSTGGAACQPDQWRKFRHDEWNSGAYGMDTRRPARIADLVASGALTLTFTAVGDDARCGTATSYELRTSPAPITESNFAAADPISLAPPGPAGAPESLNVAPPAGAIYFALRAVDEAGNAGPLAFAQTGTPSALQLSKVRITRHGGGEDRFVIKAHIDEQLFELGLPGEDIRLTLSNAGGDFFDATVPAAELDSNARGNKLRFRDPTGTIAGGIIRLKIGGATRSDVLVRARDVDLGAAAAGPFTTTLTIGGIPHEGTGILRAKGARLVFP